MDTLTMETLPTTGLTWEAVCNDPALRDLPYKIELNEHGQLLMSPTRLRHGDFQFEIGYLLRQFAPQGGKVITECAVRTAAGTRVADVAWFSQTRWTPQQEAFEADPAPEICVEVLSPGNTEDEMHAKRALYAAAGAREVWVCDLAGRMHFFDADGRIRQSKMVPGFPEKIEL